MQRIQIYSNEIEPLYGYDLKSPNLVARIREHGLEGLPPIPVIEIPEELRQGKKKYSCCDGTKRYNAAVEIGINSLDCILYDEKDNIQEVSKQTGEAYLISYKKHLVAIEFLNRPR